MFEEERCRLAKSDMPPKKYGEARATLIHPSKVGVSMRAILFDLDETLILDEPVSQQAFAAAASLAAPLIADPAVVAAEAGAVARRLWAEGPAYAYCQRIGHSSWEGLWARYDRGSTRTCRCFRSGRRVTGCLCGSRRWLPTA